MVRGSRLSQYAVSLHKFLGYGVCKLSIATSAFLATISVFYVYTLGNHLPIIVYYFLTRFTYIKPFNEYLTSRYFDGIIIGILTFLWLTFSINAKLARFLVSAIFGILLVLAVVAKLENLMSLIELASLPLIICLILYQGWRRRRNKKALRNYNFGLTLNYLIIIAIVLGIFSILISLSVILLSQNFSVDNIFTTKRIPVDNYGYEIFVFFSTISPLLLIVIFFGLPIKTLWKVTFDRIHRYSKKGRFQIYELERSAVLRLKKVQMLYLLLFVLLSVSLALVPQLSTVNKDNQQIGSDSESYVRWITRLNQTETLQDFMKTAFVDLVRGDRPLSLIFVYFFTSAATNMPLLDAIEYVPLILSPVLVIAVYFFTRELTSNETASLFAAFLTGLGYFQVSMGVYAGFYANWIALVLGYSSLIFFFRYLRTSSWRSLLIFYGLLLSVLFSHTYTWTVFIIVMSIFLTISFALKYYRKSKTILLLLVVISSVAVDFVRTITAETLGAVGGVNLTLSLAQRSIGLKDLGLVWETLVDATQHHFGGILSNIIVISLVIFWLIRSDLRTDFNMFVMIFLVTGIPLLFIADWIVQSRVFYNIPFQIPAAIAMTYLSRLENVRKVLPPMYVWLVAISLWTVSNFYEVSPT